MQKFTQPIAKPGTMRIFSILNNLLILRGIPVLRHVWGFRPWSRITKIHFSKADQQKLREVTGTGKSVHFVPVHPMFFIDWMIDKRVTDMVAPKCAHWAAGGVVNGMGKFVKRMCLSNNIIAQGTDEPEKARAFSVQQAANGTGVLLHPAGRVNWFSNRVDPLLPGAAQMAQETYAHDQVKEAYLAPITWKTVFTKDVTAALLREYRYTAKRMGYSTSKGITPAEAVCTLYTLLLGECEVDWFKQWQNGTVLERRNALGTVVYDYLDCETDINTRGAGWTVYNRVNKWLSQNKDHPDRAKVKAAQKALGIVLELSHSVFTSKTMTQEEAADHLKRIRSTHCTGKLRDAINKNAPRLAGPAALYISVPDPLLVEKDADPHAVTELLHTTMQKDLDALAKHAHAQHSLVSWPNPFNQVQ